MVNSIIRRAKFLRPHDTQRWFTLREVGKKNQAVLEAFLDKNVSIMPRTMLRYAIERFPPDQRRAYLLGKNSLDDQLNEDLIPAMAKRGIKK